MGKVEEPDSGACFFFDSRNVTSGCKPVRILITNYLYDNELVSRLFAFT
jgi:hypothetical protein